MPNTCIGKILIQYGLSSRGLNILGGFQREVRLNCRLPIDHYEVRMLKHYLARVAGIQRGPGNKYYDHKNYKYTWLKNQELSVVSVTIHIGQLTVTSSCRWPITTDSSDALN